MTESARERLVRAAFVEFAANGFKATTIDQIAEAAGVNRRTFFRYFATKEDVIFPEHARLQDLVAEELEHRADEPPLDAVCASLSLVLNDYVRNREVSLLRFGLTRSIGELRDREITSVHRYQRLFARHLRDRMSADPLEAELRAVSVVAAHNSVLRDWLVAGGTGDPGAALDAALLRVRAMFSHDVSKGSVVAVLTPDASPAEVLEVLERLRRT